MRDREKERAAGSKHRFLAEGIDFRWKEFALLVTALGPLAYIAAALGTLNCLTAALGP